MRNPVVLSVLFLYSLLTFSQSAYSSELYSQCKDCPKELYIHLASGFFSTFGKRSVELEPVTNQVLDEKILNNLMPYLESFEQESSAYLAFSKLKPNGDLNYIIRGSLSGSDIESFSTNDHHYYYLNDKEALYQLNLTRGDKQYSIIGDVPNPKASIPEFHGVLVDENKSILYKLKIIGRSFEKSDALLMKMERYMFEW